MAALTAAQQAAVAQKWANDVFVAQSITANFGADSINAAAAALDNAFDATLNQAVAAVGGTTTVINGLNAIIPQPFQSATAQQKTLLCCYVLMKRAGLI